MSILDTDKIDIIGTKPGSNRVKLIISDHLDWADLETHSRRLQDKINTYIAFVESGQLARTIQPPIPDDPDVTIALVVQQEPSDEAMAFLTRVKAFLAGLHIGFAVEVHRD